MSKRRLLFAAALFIGLVSSTQGYSQACSTPTPEQVDSLFHVNGLELVETQSCTFRIGQPDRWGDATEIKINPKYYSGRRIDDNVITAELHNNGGLECVPEPGLPVRAFWCNPVQHFNYFALLMELNGSIALIRISKWPTGVDVVKPATIALARQTLLGSKPMTLASKPYTESSEHVPHKMLPGLWKIQDVTRRTGDTSDPHSPWQPGDYNVSVNECILDSGANLFELIHEDLSGCSLIAQEYPTTNSERLIISCTRSMYAFGNERIEEDYKITYDSPRHYSGKGISDHQFDGATPRTTNNRIFSGEYLGPDCNKSE